MTQIELDKSAAELRIELRQVRAAVSKVLDDYEATAKTLDRVTANVSGVEATNHGDNVETLKSDLLETLQSNSDTIDPPWIRDGYDSKQAYLESK